ncbi:MAG: acyl carrier protein [Lachnospiraceae bacterium]|nr:acyl carrier protein [Lachnospiraceae bacterium]
MDTIYSMLEEIRPEFDFRTSEDFIEDGFLDSFDVVALVTELENKFNVVIDALDILPENFSSVETIIAVVKKSGGKI